MNVRVGGPEAFPDAQAAGPIGAPMRAAIPAGTETAMAVLLAISLSHGLNDVIQSLLPALYPLLKQEFSLDFSQIGLITLTFQLTASLLQPMVGAVTDRRAMPYSLPAGMGVTLTGLLLLAYAPSYEVLLVAAALVGVGSSI